MLAMSRRNSAESRGSGRLASTTVLESMVSEVNPKEDGQGDVRMDDAGMAW
jgi:hypothetical protein